MDPMEEAEAFKKYVVDFGWGAVSELAKKIVETADNLNVDMILMGTKG